MPAVALSLDELSKDLQEWIFRRNPMLVVGSGSSVAAGVPLSIDFPSMDALAEALCKHIPDRLSKDPEGIAQWAACEASLEELGLEGALHKHAISNQHLLSEIVQLVAACVAQPDTAFGKHTLSGDVSSFPLQRLVEFLLAGVPAHDPVLAVLTPNYDRLVEYACFLCGALCCTLFISHGVNCFDPDACDRAYRYVQTVRARGRLRGIPKRLRHVALFKPHGSIDWFQSKYGPVALGSEAEGLPRLMVTPGATKYETSLKIDVLDRHRQAANDAVSRAHALMFYGYGFNDGHLETALNASMTRHRPALILAKKLTPGAETIIEKYPHVWALAEGDSGATVCRHDGEETVIDEPIWDLDSFLSEVEEV